MQTLCFWIEDENNTESIFHCSRSSALIQLKEKNVFELVFKAEVLIPLSQVEKPNRFLV